jgi:hypothetical protein
MATLKGHPKFQKAHYNLWQFSLTKFRLVVCSSFKNSREMEQILMDETEFVDKLPEICMNLL